MTPTNATDESQRQDTEETIQIEEEILITECFLHSFGNIRLIVPVTFNFLKMRNYVIDLC